MSKKEILNHQRWRLKLEYDGSYFCGWQKQSNETEKLLSIESTLENAIFCFSQERPAITTAGRTDKGVHAKEQTVHLDLATVRSEYEVREGLNFYLKESGLAVLEASKTTKDFNARFSATSRNYVYKIIIRPSPLAIDKNRCWHIPDRHSFNFSLLEKACTIFQGYHDFSGFRASGCQAKNPQRHLPHCKAFVDKQESQCNIDIEFSAKAFLYQQVRFITGAVVACAKGNISLNDIEKRFQNPKYPLRGFVVAPAKGLYLINASYN